MIITRHGRVSTEGKGGLLAIEAPTQSNQAIEQLKRYYNINQSPPRGTILTQDVCLLMCCMGDTRTGGIRKAHKRHPLVPTKVPMAVHLGMITGAADQNKAC